MTGDFGEEFKDIERTEGRTRALWWLWRQVFCAALSRLKLYFVFGGVMFKNSLKITLRSLKKHKSYSFINIAGLTVGMAAVILILLYVRHELSYDRFHRDAGNIYLVLRGERGSFMAPTSKLLGPALESALPEVLDTTSFSRVPGTEKLMVAYGEKSFEEDISLADSSFFEMFSFPFLEGSPDEAFEHPASMLMTEHTSRKYFDDGSPLGKTVRMYMFGQKIDMKITGVLEDLPANTHFKCGIFISCDIVNLFGLDWDRWDNQVLKTYIRVREDADIQNLPNKILACEKQHQPGSAFGQLSYGLLPVTDIHLHGKNIKFLSTTGDMTYIAVFSIAAFLLLCIAGINYMNLSTAFSLRRIKEIGVRKSAGASRRSLIRQFLGETMTLSFLSLFSAAVLTQLLLPFFNRISGKSLSIPYGAPLFWGGAAVLVLVTGLLAGYYPALFLSSLKPLWLMKTKSKPGVKGASFRKGLLVFQFSLSILLIISTLVVYDQLSFIRNSPLGYDKENILCLKVRGDISRSYEALKNALMDHPGILSVCRSEPLDTDALTNTDGVFWKGKRRNAPGDFRILRADFDFVSTYGISMVKGRFYSPEFGGGLTESYVINETAARTMEMESPLGKEIRLWGRKGLIIGVMNDFHFGSLHRPIEPLIVLIPGERQQALFLRLISVRMKPAGLHAGMTYIKNTWKNILPGTPFDYYFQDDALNTKYRAEERMGTLFKYFTLLAVFIAALGLYGLTALSAEQKVKEVGIRKVLGASVSNLTVLLSKEYLVWVVCANIIAWPAAWFLMHRWLQNFAYRTSIHWWIFVLAGGLGFVIALLTVCSLTLRTARQNPVDSLRYE